MARAGFTKRRSHIDEVSRYLRACEPSSVARLGVISNPMARTNWRTRGHGRLRRVLPAPEDAVMTPAMRDIPWALDYLLFQRGCNVLGINGGDGTIHHVIQGLFQIVEEASERVGQPVPLPILVLLNGGGMNMVARVVATRADPVETVRRFIQSNGGRPLEQVTTCAVGLLEVCEQGKHPRRGLVFGSQLVRNALTLYERLGRGYVGLTRLLVRAGAGAWLETRDWKENRHLLIPPADGLLVDGERFEPYTLAVASTIPLAILKGLICALPRHPPPGEMDGLVIQTGSPTEVIQLIPAMMRAATVPGLTPFRSVCELNLSGPYTLDGECLGTAETGAIQVRAIETFLKVACPSGDHGAQAKVARDHGAS